MRDWTRFHDVHSGGYTKLPMIGDDIWIEAPKNEAKSVFYSRFGKNPDTISCNCCGPDYDIWEMTEADFDVLDEKQFPDRSPAIIYCYEILNGERHAEVPVTGWVWHE